jgi:hypothetical protein
MFEYEQVQKWAFTIRKTPTCQQVVAYKLLEMASHELCYV